MDWIRGWIVSHREIGCFNPQLTPEAEPKAKPAVLHDVATLPTSDTLPDLPLGLPEETPDSGSDVEWELEACIQRASAEATAWEDDRFEKVKLLQQAARNQGRVEMMHDLDQGCFVAVKRMPISWTMQGHDEFLEAHKTEVEMPWVDVGTAQYLSSKDYPFICDIVGVFHTPLETLVVSTLATEGDLFTWSQLVLPDPGPEREEVMRPIAQQVIAAVTQLHALGLAHLDLSLENILITCSGESGSPEVKLIDFAMSTTQKCLRGPRGKPSYQAPEMHRSSSYDPAMADCFSVGVILFCMYAKDYPWMSTRPYACKCWQFASTKGFPAYLEKRKSRHSGGNKLRLLDVFSQEVVEILDGLLQAQPELRAPVGLRDLS